MQNPILAGLKIIVMTAFAVLVGLNLFATEGLEEKVLRTRETMEGVKEGVAENNRRLDKASRTAEEAKDAADRSYERLNALLDAIERGGYTPGPENGGTTSRPPRDSGTARPAGRGEPSVIAGKKVWPKNPGWTVLCDKGANHDPLRDLPQDEIDWDASMPATLTGEPKGLNWYSDDRTVTVVDLARYVADQIAERKRSNPVEWNAMLAERVEESPDRLRHRIYIRRGVRWHRPALDLSAYPWLDGSFEVTGRDIKYTIDIIRDPNSSSGQKYIFDELESVELLDDYTVEVTWKRPNYYSRAHILELRPLPEHIYAYNKNGKRYDAENIGAAFNNHWFSKSMCGNGPYRFAAYKLGDTIRYERNENYWGRRGTCKEILYTIVKDPETRLNRFFNGETISVGLQPEQYRRFILDEEAGKIPNYEKFGRRAPKGWDKVYFIWRRPVYGGFAWNMRREPFQDRQVRTAMTYALNRQAVVDKLFYGLGELLSVGQSVFSPYYPKDIQPLPYDLDRAATLLDEAGWKDSDGDGIRDKRIGGELKQLEPELIISASSPLQSAIAQMYKADLLKIGMKLETIPVNSALWSQKNAEFDFDGLIIFWFADWESDPQQLWKSKYATVPGSNNYPGFADKEADEIFDQLVTTFDMEKRIELFHRWYEIQHREQPYSWIWSVHTALLLNTKWSVPEPKLAPPYVDRRLIFRWKNR